MHIRPGTKWFVSKALSASMLPKVMLPRMRCALVTSIIIISRNILTMGMLGRCGPQLRRDRNDRTISINIIKEGARTGSMRMVWL